MDRRNFFQILSTTSAGVLTSGCSRTTDALIPLLVPESEIVPGEEQWHPAICGECSAGCGTLVRIMEGERTIERDGQRFRQRVAAIKKIEGNPLDPVSGGRLCARGQASVQALYHPDRLRGPMKRTGDRGKGQFAAISWDEAMALAASRISKADPRKIVFLTGPGSGTRSIAIERFTKALGAPAPVVCSLTDFAIERKAAETVFGWQGLPVYDLSRARYVVGVGADFLGGWASPVYYSRQFGAFRQERIGIRGHLVQAESRLSTTAAAADRWLPLRPGTEPQFLAAAGRILLDAGLARNREQLPKPVAAMFQSADIGAMLSACGLDERRVREAIQELGESEGPLVIAGASIPHGNSLDAVLASHYVNLMLGSIGKAGGVLPPATAAGSPNGRNIAEALSAQLVLIAGANPVYTLPRASGLLDALARAETVITFASFLDDSAAWSDLVLPGHHTLESEGAVVPVVSPGKGITVATPFVRPLYDTRPVEKMLADLGRFEAVTVKTLLEGMDRPPSLSDEDIKRQGGVWVETKSEGPAHVATVELTFAAPVFAGEPSQYPFQFQPYPSLQYGDGSGAHLPWLQELPDPISSAIWGLPVEIDPRVAAKLQIANGDIVRVDSPHGSLEAPAYVHPGAVPNVVSMAIGDGHTHYGRYASERGANPISILAPVWEKATGALALGATRVRLTRVGGRRDWIQFSAPDREKTDFGHR